ncbi:hypothetical protein DQM68_04200 [Leptospira mayottensis]|nr:hypothetical protein DQM68_04200 [Leptospira mayottensis]AXR67578.1 hypothetical protein DPV73_05700 [Leptospira mayottensis]TGN01769.1 hypothetical protein EHR03_12810 [Leptospira mayottensis]
MFFRYLYFSKRFCLNLDSHSKFLPSNFPSEHFTADHRNQINFKYRIKVIRFLLIFDYLKKSINVGLIIFDPTLRAY